MFAKKVRKKLDNETILYLSYSVESEKYPVRKDHTRMDGFVHIIIKKEGSNCRETMYTMMDLKGMFPAAIANLIMTHFISDVRAK